MNPFSQSANTRLFALSALAIAMTSFGIVASVKHHSCPVLSAAEQCALPAEVDFTALSQTTADELARRAALCIDFESGRMIPEVYISQLSSLGQTQELPTPVSRRWAKQVIASSSQYSDESWSAQMALGSANVYPGHGDNTLAWASETADDQVEFLELAVPGGRVSGVEVYETFNPGAITSIELISTNGKRNSVYSATAAPSAAGSALLDVDFSCTEEEIVAVRVTLNSPAVPGWNEIDALAVKPCQ